jgi:hypothetical protein
MFGSPYKFDMVTTVLNERNDCLQRGGKPSKLMLISIPRINWLARIAQDEEVLFPFAP